MTAPFADNDPSILGVARTISAITTVIALYDKGKILYRDTPATRENEIKIILSSPDYGIELSPEMIDRYLGLFQRR